MEVKFSGSTEKLKQMGKKLQANPNVMEELAKDPQKFLKQFGLEVDGETAKAIQARAKQGPKPKSGVARPSSIVHIDVS
ncbi:MAG: hypothetical protein M3362_21000 [Acidobacteriota bacterium]|nr:hypothetical protein [Acidobacteriota bacterium]